MSISNSERKVALRGSAVDTGMLLLYLARLLDLDNRLTAIFTDALDRLERSETDQLDAADLRYILHLMFEEAGVPDISSTLTLPGWAI